MIFTFRFKSCVTSSSQFLNTKPLSLYHISISHLHQGLTCNSSRPTWFVNIYIMVQPATIIGRLCHKRIYMGCMANPEVYWQYLSSVQFLLKQNRHTGPHRSTQVPHRSPVSMYNVTREVPSSHLDEVKIKNVCVVWDGHWVRRILHYKLEIIKVIRNKSSIKWRLELILLYIGLKEWN